MKSTAANQAGAVDAPIARPFAPMRLQSYMISLLLCVATTGNAQTSNLFGVHLVTESIASGFGSNQWLSAPLQQPPVISDKDLVSVDLTNHMMEVREDVFKRLPKPTVHGTPFVLVAGGERIFPGRFWTLLSSFSTTDPTIVVDHIPGKNYLRFQWLADPKNDPWSDPRIRRTLEKINKIGHVEFP